MSKALSSRSDKVAWLIRNQTVWTAYPRGADGIERQVIEKMRQDGLLSANTHNRNVLDLGGLIADARDEIKHRNRT